MNNCSLTPIIAGILALIFAIAAVWNSYIRRKHVRELETEIKKREPSSNPYKFTMPAQAAPSANNEVEKIPQKPVEPPPPQALFRKVIPGEGEVVPNNDDEKSHQYNWE